MNKFLLSVAASVIAYMVLERTGYLAKIMNGEKVKEDTNAPVSPTSDKTTVEMSIFATPNTSKSAPGKPGGSSLALLGTTFSPFKRGLTPRDAVAAYTSPLWPQDRIKLNALN